MKFKLLHFSNKLRQISLGAQGHCWPGESCNLVISLSKLNHTSPLFAPVFDFFIQLNLSRSAGFLKVRKIIQSLWTTVCLVQMWKHGPQYPLSSNARDPCVCHGSQVNKIKTSANNHSSGPQVYSVTTSVETRLRTIPLVSTTLLCGSTKRLCSQVPI